MVNQNSCKLLRIDESRQRGYSGEYVADGEQHWERCSDVSVAR